MMEEETMYLKKELTQNFLRISQEHTLIYEYIEKLEKIINRQKHSKLFTKLKSIVLKLENDIYDHFILEERVFFPTTLLCIPSLETIDLVLKLQKEHGFLERDMQKILDFIHDQPNKDQAIHEPLLAILRQFVKILKDHADEEINTLFPKLEADKKSNEVIKDLVKKFDS